MGQVGGHEEVDQRQRTVKSSEIQYCVSRLLRRGLLVCGEGDSPEAAVVDLLLKVFVTPNRLTFSLRFRALCMGLSHGFSVKGAFSGIYMNENERLLLGKLSQSGNLSMQLEELYQVLEDNAKWIFRLLPEYHELRETIKLDFLLSVVQLYKKKRRLLFLVLAPMAASGIRQGISLCCRAVCPWQCCINYMALLELF